MIKYKSAITELIVFNTLTKKNNKTIVASRDFYSLSYRYNGKVSIKSKNVEFVSTANTITFIPKNTSYETEIIEDTQMIVVHFKLNNDITFCNPSILEVTDKSIRFLFEKLFKSYNIGETIDFTCMSNFYELLANLESIQLLKNNLHLPKKIAYAKEKMLQNFYDPYFSISTLAESTKISTAYLRREFSRFYGKSPCSFLRDLRITNAKNLLQYENLSILQISEQSGFASVSYFIQVFGKVVGESPEKYRRKILQNLSFC